MGKPYKLSCDGDIVSLAEYCRRKNISYGGVKRYKSRHPDDNYENILKYYENLVIDVRFRSIWRNMVNRCTKIDSNNYKYYGGKGIKVCKSWLDYNNFCADMYESYQKHVKECGEKDTTLDRIDVNGDYEPENCRWATYKEQNNNKRNNVITPTGETLREYCERNNLNYSTISVRIQRGWSMEKAISTAIKQIKHSGKIVLPSGELLSNYCKRNNINIRCIYNRLHRGWSWDKILNTPIQTKYKKKNQ